MNKAMLMIHALMGRTKFKPTGPAARPDRKCLLPGCNVYHTHNGGYCCADHCKWHRTYSVVAASQFEVGLLRGKQGIRTWWAKEFGGQLPPLGHPTVLEAIRITEGVVE